MGPEPLWSATYRYIDGPLVTEATSLQRSWTPEDVALLANAGLQVQHLWGDFDERPFRETAARLLVVAQKR